MRVLVTGSAGKLGRIVAAELTGAGHDVAGFDLRRGRDVRRERRPSCHAGCAAIVHLARAVLGWRPRYRWADRLGALQGDSELSSLSADVELTARASDQL